MRYNGCVQSSDRGQLVLDWRKVNTRRQIVRTPIGLVNLDATFAGAVVRRPVREILGYRGRERGEALLRGPFEAGKAAERAWPTGLGDMTGAQFARVVR